MLTPDYVPNTLEAKDLCFFALTGEEHAYPLLGWGVMKPTCSDWPGHSEALLLSAADQVRGGTPAHSLCWNTTARSSQGLVRLRYGLDWKATRDTYIAWAQ